MMMMMMMMMMALLMVVRDAGEGGDNVDVGQASKDLGQDVKDL